MDTFLFVKYDTDDLSVCFTNCFLGCVALGFFKLESTYGKITV